MPVGVLLGAMGDDCMDDTHGETSSAKLNDAFEIPGCLRHDTDETRKT
jgi:hypothetical protein